MDRDGSARRIERDIETLAGPDYTLTSEAIRRYAYTDVYRRTLDYFVGELEALGFDVEEDAVGTLTARNRPKGEPVFGVGSHCDSNRNGGKYDGTMGVVTALEVCRLNEEQGLDLPLQLISFLEEEGSGFGQMLLGSRIIAQRVTEEDLRERFRSLDDGRSFWEHAADAGYQPERWRECAHVLDDLTGWIEMHIEQARVLQDTGNRIGLVTAIAGYVHADVVVHGRGDHAGATPMDFRLDPTLPLADTILALERMAREAGQGTVGTVGEIEVDPGIINAIAAQRPLLARHPRPRRGRLQGRGARDRGLHRAGRRRARADGGVPRAPVDPADTDGRPHRRRAGDGHEGHGRAVHAHALGRGARHDVRRRPRPDRDGLRPLRRGNQPPPGRGREPGRRGPRGRDHPERDQDADVVARL